MKLKPIVILIIASALIAAILLINSNKTKEVNSNKTTEGVSQADEQKIRETMAQKFQFKIEAIADSPVAGLQQVYTDKGLFYASNDGEYFMQARIYNMGAEKLIDETENVLKDIRLDGLKNFADSMIEFPAENEKYVISVFTDSTCGYCRKLHNEIQQYHDLGISVRYLAWPRGGLNSQTYRDTVSIWCSADPQQALTDAKAGKQIARNTCENDVAEQFQFGQKVGVQGTPNIVLSDGSVVPGYQSASQLLQRIKAAS